MVCYTNLPTIPVYYSVHIANTLSYLQLVPLCGKPIYWVFKFN